MGLVRDTYELVTERILEQLDAGVVPWRRPWREGLQSNLASRKPYRGVNVFLLAAAGYTSPYWVTYRQAAHLGGHVRKGESGTGIIFWKWIEKKNVKRKDGAVRYPLLRRYTVFNIEQCAGLEPPIPPLDFEPVDAAESIVRRMPDPPRIEHKEPRAYYLPRTDMVNMPQKETFSPPEEYYSTLFHELIHSTGHQKRLNRFGQCPGTSKMRAYSLEELVAEMGAAFLCAHARIERRSLDNQAAYIQGWLRKLRDDRKLVVAAGAQAQRAADYVRGV